MSRRPAPRPRHCEPRCAFASPSIALLGRYGFPPLAPPLRSHEDAQLHVPAVRNKRGRLEVVEAVLALLLARRHALQHGVRRQDPKVHRQLLVDLLRLWRWNLVVRHRRTVFLFPSVVGSTIDIAHRYREVRRYPGYRRAKRVVRGSRGTARSTISVAACRVSLCRPSPQSSASLKKVSSWRLLAPITNRVPASADF